MNKKEPPKEEFTYSVRVKINDNSLSTARHTVGPAHHSPAARVNQQPRGLAMKPTSHFLCPGHAFIPNGNTEHGATKEHNHQPHDTAPPAWDFIALHIRNQYPHEPACIYYPLYTSNHHKITQVDPGEVTRGAGNELIYKCSQKKE